MAWTVETNAKVTEWLRSHSAAKGLYDKAVTAIKASGAATAVTNKETRLRHVGKAIYDIECQGDDSNYRIVGLDDPKGKKFEFLAIYSHPKGGGKKKEKGEGVRGY